VRQEALLDELKCSMRPLRVTFMAGLNHKGRRERNEAILNRKAHKGRREVHEL
jgi:hypothetical protein